MTCVNTCKYRGKHSDAAKRISEAASLGWIANGWDGYVGHWMAFTLEAGMTDHVLYPTKPIAIAHMADEFKYLYLKMHPGGMEVCEAEVMLEFYRSAYKAGFRLADPASPDIIPRIGSSELSEQITALRKAGG
jgi:hypothetical protein